MAAQLLANKSLHPKEIYAFLSWILSLTVRDSLPLGQLHSGSTVTRVIHIVGKFELPFLSTEGMSCFCFSVNHWHHICSQPYFSGGKLSVVNGRKQSDWTLAPRDCWSMGPPEGPCWWTKEHGFQNRGVFVAFYDFWRFHIVCIGYFVSWLQNISPKSWFWILWAARQFSIIWTTQYFLILVLIVCWQFLQIIVLCSGAMVVSVYSGCPVPFASCTLWG